MTPSAFCTGSSIAPGKISHTGVHHSRESVCKQNVLPSQLGRRPRAQPGSHWTSLSSLGRKPPCWPCVFAFWGGLTALQGNLVPGQAPQKSPVSHGCFLASKVGTEVRETRLLPVFHLRRLHQLPLLFLLRIPLTLPARTACKLAGRLRGRRQYTLTSYSERGGFPQLSYSMFLQKKSFLFACSYQNSYRSHGEMAKICPPGNMEGGKDQC